MRARVLFSHLEGFAPLAIMGVLTLVSFSALKSLPPVNKAVAARPVVQDYSMDRFSMAQFGASGHLDSLIKGEHAIHSVENQNITIQNFVFIHKNQQYLYQGTSEWAKVSDDGDQLLLKDHAVLIRSARQADAKTTITRLTSNQLTLNHRTHMMDLQGGVKIQHSHPNR